MTQTDACRLLGDMNISADRIIHAKGSFGKDIFLIDDKYILRPSLENMDGEIERFRRIEHLSFVPKIIATGCHEGLQRHYYILLTQIVGAEYFTQIPELNDLDNARLGSSIAAFLDDLHGNSGCSYDIGHYAPIIGGFDGSWKDGHVKYREYLYERISGIRVSAMARNVIEEAFSYLETHQDSLGYQSGPVLLHNDFHPRNIIVENGTFSGVIDWECSQYGEADFDLCHLLHWCAFPPKKECAYDPALKKILQSPIRCAVVPRLDERLTIYEIEHELIQLIWSGGSSEAARIPRIRKWLRNEVESFIGRIRA